MKLWKRVAGTTVVMVVVAAGAVRAEDITFPTDSGVINVKNPPYNATGNGVTDDTLAIQQALNANPGGNKIIYLPNGVYRVTNTLKWAGTQKRNILQGQSRDGAILRLPDSCSGYTATGTPKAVIWTGQTPAQRFRNSIRDLTVNVGSNNVGAIGIQFIANNQGSLRDVQIISQDGQGIAGLDLRYTDQIGPLLVQDLEVVGFNEGIRSDWDTASLTFENVMLRNQKVYGWHNRAQMCFVRNLMSSNAVTVIYNEKDSNADFQLLGAELTGLSGASTKPAILNQKRMYVRDVVTRGYQTAIVHSDKGRGNEPGVYGPVVQEWGSAGKNVSQFPTPEQPLQLPVEETPAVAWGNIATDWVSPLAYGGVPNDSGDDTVAIQAAVDSGKKTIYLPNGSWTVNGTLYLRGNVERLIGTEATISGSGQIVLSTGTAPVVVTERIDANYSSVKWEHAANRTWVISSVSLGSASYRNTGGNGDLFLEDVVGGPFVFSNQIVWARQLNQETDTQATGDINDAKIVNVGASVWIFGLKTEKAGTIIRTQNGGATELLGAFVYCNGSAKTEPEFISRDSSVSIAGVDSRTWNSALYPTWMSETRGGTTLVLTNMSGLQYLGYISGSEPSVPPEVVLDCENTNGIAVVGAWTTITNNINAIHGASYLTDGNTGKGTKSVTFTPNLPTAGNWEVFLKFPAGQSTNTPVDIVHGGVTNTVLVNQKQSGSWGISLGTNSFNAGSGGSVKIRTDGTSGTVVADAVQFIQRHVNVAPDCSITSPTNSTTFTAPASITIQASASDIDGTVSQVEFYQGATKLGEAASAPYQYAWTNVPAGSYTLTAKATDNNGATTISAGINVIVLTAYAQWRQAHFTPGQLVDLSVSGDLACPAGDGICNLLKYAMGLDPFTAVGKGPAQLSTTNGYLTITFTQNNAASDVTLVVEGTSALTNGAWSTNGIVEIQRQFNSGSNTWTVTDRDGILISTATNRFLRLHVNRP
jgi:hypothetical protein